MPSPLGHSLGGVVAGWLIGGSPRPDPAPSRLSLIAVLRSAAVRRSALGFGLLGVLADFDFLFGTHSTYSHSVGAAAMVFVVALASSATGRSGTMRGALAASAAYASHILLDWLGTDGAAPFGIMALWPFSSEFYLAGVGLFAPVERRFWLPDFWWRTLRMLMIEIAILGPLLMLAWRGRAARVRRT